MSWSHPIWTRFLPTRTILACARLGPIGRARYAPGTWGSVAGLVYQLLIFHPLSSSWSKQFLAGCLDLFGVWFAIAVCGEAEFRLGRKDPGEVILDEFVAMPFCFIGWRALEVGPWPPALIFVAGFALFRLFDITKPLGIAKLQDLPGGWGIVIDDIAAALATCITMHASARLWLHFHG